VNSHVTKYSARITPLLLRWAIILFLFIPVFAHSGESVLAVLSKDAKIYNDFYSALQKKLNVDVVKIAAADVNNKTLSKHSFIITVGYSAAKKVSEYKLNATVVYSLIYNNKQPQYKFSCVNANCYYIYINQSVARYVKLFKRLFPQDRVLVLATTKADTIKSQQLKIEAEKIGVNYKELIVKTDENITRTFINKLSNRDVLLALPNASIYNANNAKSILLSTYHKDIPIIAYSKAFVKAGAIAGLYSGIEHVADQTARTVNTIMESGQQEQKEYYPDDFTIEFNSSVARSLNIDIDSINLIKRELK